MDILNSIKPNTYWYPEQLPNYQPSIRLQSNPKLETPDLQPSSYKL